MYSLFIWSKRDIVYLSRGTHLSVMDILNKAELLSITTPMLILQWFHPWTDAIVLVLTIICLRSWHDQSVLQIRAFRFIGLIS